MPFFKSSRSNSGRGTSNASSGKPKKGGALNFPLIIGGFALIGVSIAVYIGMSTMSKHYTYFTATRDIPAGAYLTEGDLQAVTGNGDPSGPNIIVGTDDMNARLGTLVIRELLFGDTFQYSTVYFLRADQVSAPGDALAGQHFAYRFTEILPPGSRAIVINGDPTTTFVHAGDYMDVYFSDESSVRRMFEAKVIYAIPQPDPAAGAATEGGVSTPNGTSFVLDLTPQQAQDLVYAQTHGTIRVGLAAPNVDPNSNTATTDSTTFDKTYGATNVTGPSASSAPNSGSSLPPLSVPTSAPTAGVPGLPSPAASK